MDRKKFIKNALITGVIGAIAPQMLSASKRKEIKSTYDKLMDKVGFKSLHGGHADLPNKINTMQTILHKAETRGHANHGWLNSYHTFSFANYHNPERMNFGLLRVLNDDTVQAGMGFGTHPHDNMEIISIPLYGDLEHKDSMGNVTVIKEGEVQAMSAGTGVTHSEKNKNSDKEVKFLQIWVFPKVKNVTPKYDQISLKDIEIENEFYQVLSPIKEDQGVWIHQDAWFHIGKFTKGHMDEYLIKKAGNGVYAFILDGEVEINNEKLTKRDGMGIWNTEGFQVKATANARVLLMEVPMTM